MTGDAGCAEQVQGGEVLLQAAGGPADRAVPVHEPGCRARPLPHRPQAPGVSMPSMMPSLSLDMTSLQEPRAWHMRRL